METFSHFKSICSYLKQNDLISANNSLIESFSLEGFHSIAAFFFYYTILWLAIASIIHIIWKYVCTINRLPNIQLSFSHSNNHRWFWWKEFQCAFCVWNSCSAHQEYATYHLTKAYGAFEFLCNSMTNIVSALKHQKSISSILFIKILLQSLE